MLLLTFVLDITYDHVDFTGYHTGYHDTTAVVDLQTYRTIPWEDDILQLMLFNVYSLTEHICSLFLGFLC